MWRRIVNLLLRRPCPARSDAVEALFAENLTAHERTGQASEAVTRASDSNRERLETVRGEIAQRMAATRHARPEPTTSEVRAVVEDVLNRPGLRGIGAKDPS